MTWGTNSMLTWSTTSRPGFAVEVGGRASGTADTTASSTGWPLWSLTTASTSPASAGQPGPPALHAAIRAAVSQERARRITVSRCRARSRARRCCDSRGRRRQADLVLVAHVDRPARAEGEAEAGAQDVRRGVDLVGEGVRAERGIGHDGARRREDLGVSQGRGGDVAQTQRVAAPQHEGRARLEVRPDRHGVRLLVEDVGREAGRDRALVVGRATVEGVLRAHVPPLAEPFPDPRGHAIGEPVAHVDAVLEPGGRGRDAHPRHRETQAELPPVGGGHPEGDVVEAAIALVEIAEDVPRDRERRPGRSGRRPAPPSRTR